MSWLSPNNFCTAFRNAPLESYVLFRTISWLKKYLRKAHIMWGVKQKYPMSNKDIVSFRQILSSVCRAIFAPSQKMPKINWKTGFLLILEFSASTWKGPKLDFLGQTSHLSRCLKKLRFLVTIFLRLHLTLYRSKDSSAVNFFQRWKMWPKNRFLWKHFLHSNTTTGWWAQLPTFPSDVFSIVSVSRFLEFFDDAFHIERAGTNYMERYFTGNDVQLRGQNYSSDE